MWLRKEVIFIYPPRLPTPDCMPMITALCSDPPELLGPHESINGKVGKTPRVARKVPAYPTPG